jgi:hypothetical protein
VTGSREESVKAVDWGLGGELMQDGLFIDRSGPEDCCHRAGRD